jgi:uncharacterized protein DUF3145
MRYSSTPTLGLFAAVIGVHGDILVSEDRLRAAAAAVQAGTAESETLEQELARLVGAPWDDELESFRHAGEGAPVRWLHQVG